MDASMNAQRNFILCASQNQSQAYLPHKIQILCATSGSDMHPPGFCNLHGIASNPTRSSVDQHPLSLCFAPNWQQRLHSVVGFSRISSLGPAQGCTFQRDKVQSGAYTIFGSTGSMAAFLNEQISHLCYTDKIICSADMTGVKE